MAQELPGCREWVLGRRSQIGVMVEKECHKGQFWVKVSTQVQNRECPLLPVEEAKIKW